MKPAAVWWCLEQVGLLPDEIIDVALESGCEGIELAPEEHWESIRDRGLVIVSHRGHDSIEIGLNRLDQHARIHHELEVAIDLAEAWLVPYLICFSGSRGEQSDLEGLWTCAEGLRPVVAKAEKTGVTLVIELLNSRVDHPLYQCDRSDWGSTLVEMVGSLNVKMLYDVYHAQIMEGDVIRTIRRDADRIGHFHVAGNPGRNEPNASQELNYPAIYRSMSDTGYRGWVGLEYVPLEPPLASMKAAVRQLRDATGG